MNRVRRGWRVGAVLMLQVAASCGGQATSSSDSAAAGDGTSGDLRIPDSCTTIPGDQNENECLLQVECPGDIVGAACVLGEEFIECNCISDGVGYAMTDVSLSDACTYTAALCLQWPERDVREFECLPTRETAEADHCNAQSRCTRDGVIGKARFTEVYQRIADCEPVGSGWSCFCGWPEGATLELPTTTSTPQCLDARDWCGGEGIEPVGSRTCTATLDETRDDRDEDVCVADVDCERAVLVSGHEATLHELGTVTCRRVEDGRYRCLCWENITAEVAAHDPASACSAGARACYER